MKKYNFEKTLQYNNDMLLSFEVDDFILNENKSEKEFFENMDSENKKRFYELYGDNLDREVLRKSLKKEIKRLISSDEEIEKDLISYISNKIKYDKENGEINSEKLKEYSEDLKTINYYNFGNYKILFSYLFAANNEKDFENITEALSLKKNFLHYDVLFMKTLTDDKISENFKDSEAKKLLDLYMKSKFGIKSFNQYISIINNSEDKFYDLNFVNFQTNFLNENISIISKLTQGEELNNQLLSMKTKELISSLGNHIRNKSRDIISDIKKEKSTINSLNDKIFLLNKVDDMFKSIVETIVNKNNNMVNVHDKSQVSMMLKSHSEYMRDKNIQIEVDISEKKDLLKSKKVNKLKLS